MTIQALPLRSEIPVAETWDVNAIFSTDDECRTAQTGLKEKTQSFVDKYKTKIKTTTDPQFLLTGIADYEQIIILINNIDTYISLQFAVDMRNDHLGKRLQEFQLLAAEINSELSFFSSELAETEQQVIEQAIEQTENYKQYLSDQLAYQKYLLKPQTERVLAALAPTLNLPETIYETAKAQDMDFPDFEVNGKSYPLSYVLYETKYSAVSDTEIRRNAFKAFSATLQKYHNINAEILLANFTYKETMAKLRGFKNATEAALFYQKSSRELYDRQIDLIMNELAPHMRRYAKLIQKAYNLEEMHFADLLLPLDPEFSPPVSIKDSEQYISDAIQIMGKDYHDMIMASFPERWIDFAQNIGKSTGGFCTMAPAAHPYILINWSGQLSEVFTLAHELGHAAQDILVSQNNSFLEAEMPFYLVEVPSTTHELLLSDSLLKKNDDPRFRRWVISSMIGNTYYHNAVTHLHEACFQRTVMDRIAAGEQLSANDLDNIFRELLEQFWGDAVIIDPGAEKTWMRQPHYYANLYSYTYSASLVVATDFFIKLNQNSASEPANSKENHLAQQVEKWLKFLRTGGPLDVIEHAKILDVDLTTDQPLRNMINFIGEMISELEKLSP
ncbi:MAG: oligoendopeptidase F [Clostridiaceae bacterium]|nr:oligoendopeptidase F [Clostridiaceae bacterium]